MSVSQTMFGSASGGIWNSLIFQSACDTSYLTYDLKKGFLVWPSTWDDDGKVFKS